MIGREAIQCAEHQEVGVSMANNITFRQERGRLPQQRYSAPRFRPSALIKKTQRGEVVQWKVFRVKLILPRKRILRGNEILYSLS